MKKIKWCLSVKNGIELIEPNNNLSKAYLKKSEDAIRASSVLKDNPDWEISSSYYALYFALYSVLMKIGIKCEIHACSIECMKSFLFEFYDMEDYKLLKDSMDTRIDIQYYTDRRTSKKRKERIIGATPSFLIKSKEIILSLKEQDIKTIRQRIKGKQK